MNARTETPLLDRVEVFVRGRTGKVAQHEVVAAFHGEPAGVVRLSLAALRKQNVLDGAMEEGVLWYWIADAFAPRAPDAPPLRQIGTSLTLAARNIAPSEVRMYELLRDGSEPDYTAKQAAAATGLDLAKAKKALKALVLNGKVYDDGARATIRRYSVKPFERAPGVVLGVGQSHKEPSPLKPMLPPSVPSVRPEPEPLAIEAGDKQQEPLSGYAAAKAAALNDVEKAALGSEFFKEHPEFLAAGDTHPITGKPVAAMTADRRILIVNGGRGTILDEEITTAVIELVRKFDAAGLTEEKRP